MSTIYRVKASANMQAVPCVRFAGSMAQVKEHKHALAEKCGVSARKIEHEELEIDFSKADVLRFLNEHCNGAG